MIDDPWLAADLGDDPAADQRDHRQRARRGERAVKPRRSRQPLAPDPHDHVGDPDQRQHRADRDHRLEGDADDIDRGAIRGGYGVKPLHRGAWVVEGEQRQRLRDRDASLDLAIAVPTEQVQRRPARVAREPLDRGELGRLGSCHLACRPIADQHLDR